jgi:hypothetical protein
VLICQLNGLSSVEPSEQFAVVEQLDYIPNCGILLYSRGPDSSVGIAVYASYVYVCISCTSGPGSSVGIATG